MKVVLALNLATNKELIPPELASNTTQASILHLNYNWPIIEK